MLLNDYIILDFNFCVYFILCENKDLRVFYFEINFQKQHQISGSKNIQKEVLFR